MSYTIGDDGYYMVEFLPFEDLNPKFLEISNVLHLPMASENLLVSEEEKDKKHVFAKSGHVYSVYSEEKKNIKEDDEGGDGEEEEYTLFGRYMDGKATKCVTIEISSDATINELRNAFSDAIGRKVTNISTTTNNSSISHNEFMKGDHLFISSWPDIINGCFLNIFF